MNTIIMKEITQTIEGTVLANRHYLNIWKNNVVFTWQWWIQLALTIVPIVAWIVVKKKDSTGRLLLAGFFILLISSWLDFVGNSFGIWYYPFKLVPTLPPLFPWELCITVEFLLLLQYKPAFSPWVKAIVVGLINSFIFEPFAIWLGLYVPVHWRHLYSLPIYIAIYLIAHGISQINSFKRLDE